MNESRCRGCGARIMFLRTPAEKWLPVNPELVSSDDLDDGDKLVTEAGNIVTVGGKKPDGYGIDGYVPHWATCTDPNRFRKGK